MVAEEEEDKERAVVQALESRWLPRLCHHLWAVLAHHCLYPCLVMVRHNNCPSRCITRRTIRRCIRRITRIRRSRAVRL